MGKLPLNRLIDQAAGQLFVLMVVGSIPKEPHFIYTGESPETVLF